MCLEFPPTKIAPIAYERGAIKRIGGWPCGQDRRNERAIYEKGLQELDSFVSKRGFWSVLREGGLPVYRTSEG
jgi:hypothetical protein